MKKLMELGKINSILVIFSNDTERPDYFSADSTCPNDRYGKNESQQALHAIFFDVYMLSRSDDPI